MAFTLKINGTPHKVDVDGDTPLPKAVVPGCRLARCSKSAAIWP